MTVKKMAVYKASVISTLLCSRQTWITRDRRQDSTLSTSEASSHLGAQIWQDSVRHRGPFPRWPFQHLHTLLRLHRLRWRFPRHSKTKHQTWILSPGANETNEVECCLSTTQGAGKEGKQRRTSWHQKMERDNSKRPEILDRRSHCHRDCHFYSSLFNYMTHCSKGRKPVKLAWITYCRP